MNSKEIRKAWLDFFESKNHFIVPPKSLIPVNDNSLLWINSGVATLKDYFSGKKNPPSKRMANSQKSIRTNDIENVGITARHHTFFEMLGNFSIGDYFKKEAIEFATEFVLDVLKLDRSRLYFTYFHDDLETKNLWISQGFKEEQLIPGDRKTNFWEVGKGPCGPNTEIFYDRGEKYDQRGIELLKNDIENDRYIEIWNIVFSTYNSDGEGNYTELNQKNIDTGAGLERIVSILQDAPTNFDTDLFLPIIHEIEKYTSYRYKIENYFIKDKAQEEINSYFKIIADHMRTVVNAIADGEKPSNLSRGYILRRLIRRSYYKAIQLKITKSPFLYKLVDVIKASLPFEYDSKKVAEVIKEEEVLFSQTISKGKEILEKFISENSSKDLFPGDLAYKLHETYGFPFELTEEILLQKDIKINKEEFNLAKEKHIEASRNQKEAGMDKVINSLALIKTKEDEFIGYEHTNSVSKILHLLNEENELSENDGTSYLILDKTPFYATSGGQKHDRGYIEQNGVKLEILNVFKDKFGNHVHKVVGKLSKNYPITCQVDLKIRRGLERNHSGTHLMFCALRNVFGNQIKQLGSDNNEDRLTFDTPFDAKPTDEEILKVENLVKSYIQKEVDRQYLIMDIDQAKEINAIMTLEEAEYMDSSKLRIVNFNGITADLCGGTHLENTKLLEDFKITSVEKKAAGVYRIRAISSKETIEKYLENQKQELMQELLVLVKKLKDMQFDFKVSLDESLELSSQIQEIKNLTNLASEAVKNKIKENSKKISIDLNEIELENINGNYLYLNDEISKEEIKNLSGVIREKFPNALVILISKGETQSAISFASKKYNSINVLKELANHFELRGGGNAILAMGSIKDYSKLKTFLKEKYKWEN